MKVDLEPEVLEYATFKLKFSLPRLMWMYVCEVRDDAVFLDD